MQIHPPCPHRCGQGGFSCTGARQTRNPAGEEQAFSPAKNKNRKKICKKSKITPLQTANRVI
jgi:hypothetical protein